MKKLFVLFSLTACLILTYTTTTTTTVYANEEEATTQVMPTSDEPLDPFLYDPHNM